MARRFHIALSVVEFAKSIEDYSLRLGVAPCTVIPATYALWRTETLNFSIRQVHGGAGRLRHLGWEDDEAVALSEQRDVNGITWERFTADHQQAEIRRAWPQAADEPVT